MQAITEGYVALQNLQARLPIHTAFLLVASHQNREVPSVRLNWDQQVILARLDARQSEDMLEYLARRHRLKLGPRLREQLVQRCEGVPLYLQEICRRLEIDRRKDRLLDCHWGYGVSTDLAQHCVVAS